ncbi:MAG: beta strand repeat-containing protein, partial [Bacteroidota bacterium]
YTGSLSALNITGNFYQNFHTFTAPATPNTITLGGNFTRDGGTFTANGSNLVFNNSSTSQSINGTVATNAFNLLTVNKPGQTLTVGGSITSLTLDSLVLTAGTFAPGTAATLSLTGSWLNNSAADAFTPGTSVVDFNGAGAKVIGGTFASTFNDLRSNAVNGLSLMQPVSVSTLRIGNVTANSSLSDSGNQITSAGTLLLTSGTLKIGSAVSASAFPAFSVVTLSVGTTIDFASGVMQTVPTSFSYQNLTLSNGGIKTPSIGTLTVAGNLLANSPVDLSTNNTAVALTGNLTGTGAILQGSGAFSLAGNWTNSGAFAAGSGGVNYTGGTAQTVSIVPQYQDLTFSGAGTKTIGSGTLTINGNWAVGSTTTIGNNPVVINGDISGIGAITQGTALFTLGGNWNHSGTFTIGTGGVRYNGASTQIVRTNFSYQNLTMSGAGSKVPNSGTLTVTGAWYVNAPVNLSVNNPAVSVTGNVDSAGTITMGSGNITVAGNWFNTGGTTGGTGSVILSATAPSIAGTSFGKLRLNGVGYTTLLGNVTVNDSLNLVVAKVRANGNILSVGSAGTVARTTGFVFGDLQHNIPAGSPTVTYHIGDSLNYTPVTAAFNFVSSPGYVLAKSINTNHPVVTSSGLDTAKNVNRYFTLTNNSASFTDVSPTFQFVAGDKDAGSNSNNYIVRRYNSGVWSPTTVGVRTATSTQASAVSTLGDFAIGEPKAYSITSASHGSGT